MKYVIEDLGVVAMGDTWMNWRFARDPHTKEEMALGSLSRGGFMVINPHTGRAVQVRDAVPFGCGWAVGQAPNGDIVHGDYGNPTRLCVWDWKDKEARVVAEAAPMSLFTLDVAPDGRVYLPDYTANAMFRYDPANGMVERCAEYAAFGTYIRNVVCGADGFVYVTSHRYDPGVGIPTSVVALNPKTGEIFQMGADPALRVAWNTLLKDAAGRVLVASLCWGRQVWHELVKGALLPIEQGRVRLNPGGLPLVFFDGSYVKDVKDCEVTWVNGEGRESVFTLDRQDSPVETFSVEAGGGKIWGGTFIPLTLFSYDPATGKSTGYGNPTNTGGEIYNMVFSSGKLYMGSYTRATITRYDPSKPLRKSDSVTSNPAHLGLIKEKGLPLQRPHGKAMDAAGNVYFAAHGGYGCIDSGLCRIDPRTDEMVSWIYPKTTFNALVWLKSLDQLLVSEVRQGEGAIRFTFLSPKDGSVLWSEPVIRDDGGIISWLEGEGGVVYGMHAWRATLFRFDLQQRKITAELRELRVGDHCYNALVNGEDGRLWGLTNQGIYAATRDLKTVEMLAEIPEEHRTGFYRFGLAVGPDNALYFPNGTRLMRMKG